MTLLRRPLPVTIGNGGLVPGLLFGALFAAFAAQAGGPVAAAACVGALGGTAALVVHELGHVLAARRSDGLRPAGVELIWLGAVTRIEGAYVSGRDQARVALAGPAASLGFALALLPALALPVSLATKELAVALAALNVGLAVVSLLPAYPLDGYKLGIGLLWWLLGSEAAARRLVRRAARPWLALELAGALVVLVEQRALGVTALALGAGLYAQKLYARRRA
jgi:Zn-dependent protease